ncbi:MAG: YidC/Oxa1 family membrane protein insertase [Candidatus Shapirobacteria bacterium]
MNILIAPFINMLFGFYHLTGNLGWAVVVVTVLIRLVLLPLVFPSLKSAKKMQELQPRLKKLQEKYGKEKEKLAKAQMDLYREEGVNPLSGCLPQILQIAVLILFFSAFNMVTAHMTGKDNVEEINRNLISVFRINKEFKFGLGFLGSDLTMTPAKEFAKGVGLNLILPIVLLFGSGALQYISTKLMMPTVKVDKEVVKKTEGKEDDMMSAIRTQSLYMMPLMTIFIGWGFSLGILLYWFVNSGVMLGQQLLVNKLNKKEQK